MRDICTESIIPIQPTAVDKLLKYILMGLTGVSLVLVAILGLAGIIALGICGWMLYRHLRKTDGEYEHVHTNDVFNVDIHEK